MAGGDWRDQPVPPQSCDECERLWDIYALEVYDGRRLCISCSKKQSSPLAYRRSRRARAVQEGPCDRHDTGE